VRSLTCHGLTSKNARRVCARAGAIFLAVVGISISKTVSKALFTPVVSRTATHVNRNVRVSTPPSTLARQEGILCRASAMIYNPTMPIPKIAMHAIKLTAMTISLIRLERT
jgi:hypothetical protein